VELFTLNRKFLKQDEIDVFHSAIWTERYYGDSEVELVVPPKRDLIQKLAPGTFLAFADSDEVMILETADFEDGKLKLTGISLLKWLNNRFVRTTAKHEDRYWTISAVPGEIMQDIVYYMCIGGGYLDGSIPTGIVQPQILKVPGLTIGDWDRSGAIVSVGVPYGPVFDALYEIATTYEYGQQIVLMSATDDAYSLKYRNYRGLDRSSFQNTNEPVRFSEGTDSLTDIKELQSIAAYKTLVYAFAPSNPNNLAAAPGQDGRVSIDQSFSGFDLRAEMIFADDITTDQVGANPQTLLDILNSRAKDELSNSSFVNVVDGEVVPDMQFKYGIHYNLGDLVEIQGVSGAISKARVTEYIHTQDETGARAYPTLTVKS
jgi:Siphovirus ReqiPepy6 Gp37-like protein